MKPLLGAHSVDDRLHGLGPCGVERMSVSCLFPVPMRKTNRVAERIQLILSFSNTALHRCQVVATPLKRWSIEISHESVSIRIDEEATRLTANDALKQSPKSRIFRGEREIGPHLRGGIPQPHGCNIAGQDGCIRFPFECAWPNGGIESIREAVGEQTRELGIGNAGLRLGDVNLDHGTCEVTISGRRAHGRIGLGRCHRAAGSQQSRKVRASDGSYGVSKKGSTIRLHVRLRTPRQYRHRQQ